MDTRRIHRARPFALATLAIIFVYSATAARVGVVASFPGGVTHTECVSVSAGADAYEIIGKTNLDVAWSYYPAFGHGLCGINAAGCPATNCFCDPNEYWNFYVKDDADDPWAYSQLGFDGGGTCSEHYCAADGGMIGLGYGVYGTMPEDYSFGEVCVEGDADGDGRVGYADLLVLASAYGKQAGGAGFDERADYDGNGVVGYADLVMLAAHYAP